MVDYNWSRRRATIILTLRNSSVACAIISHRGRRATIILTIRNSSVACAIISHRGRIGACTGRYKYKRASV